MVMLCTKQPGKTFEEGDSIVSITKHSDDDSNGYQNLSEQWNDQNIEGYIHFDYNRSFNEKHNVNAMLLTSVARRREIGVYQSYTNANIGIQLDYNFNHKYYLNLSGAVVNSTKLPTDERLAFSPTLGLGWVLSEEDFMQRRFL